MLSRDLVDLVHAAILLGSATGSEALAQAHASKSNT